MTGYVELHAKGDCRVLLGSGDFAGVVTPKGMSATDKATPDATLTIILRSGATLEDIYGISASKLLVYMEGVRIVMKEFGRKMLVVFIDERDAFETDLSEALSMSHG